MKKLLALMLCMMLLFGVMPAYAYAEPTAEAMAALYDKAYGYHFDYGLFYDEPGLVQIDFEVTTLLEAYAALAGAYAARMYVDGMRSLSKSLDLDGVAANLRAAGDDYKEVLENLLYIVSWYSIGGENLEYTLGDFEELALARPLDYSGLYQLLAYVGFFDYDYELIGAAISADAAIKTDKFADDAAAKYDEIAADVLANADAAMNEALRAVPALS